MTHDPALAAARALLARGEHVHLVADGASSCLGGRCPTTDRPLTTGPDTSGGAR